MPVAWRRARPKRYFGATELDGHNREFGCRPHLPLAATCQFTPLSSPRRNCPRCLRDWLSVCQLMACYMGGGGLLCRHSTGRTQALICATTSLGGGSTVKTGHSAPVRWRAHAEKKPSRELAKASATGRSSANAAIR